MRQKRKHLHQIDNHLHRLLSGGRLRSRCALQLQLRIIPVRGVMDLMRIYIYSNTKTCSLLKVFKDSSTKSENRSVIIYSPICRSKPKWASFFCWTQTNTGIHQLCAFWLPTIFKISSFVFNRRNPYSVGTTCGWENYDKIYIFGWTNSLNRQTHKGITFKLDIKIKWYNKSYFYCTYVLNICKTQVLIFIYVYGPKLYYEKMTFSPVVT